jgi:hypothetical protein
MRIALGTGFLAILSATASAILTPSQPATIQTSPASAQGAASAGGSSVAVVRPVQYVQLQPGQTAPPGATVIDAEAPTPLTIVTTIPAPPPKPVVVRTTQSGKVIP